MNTEEIRKIREGKEKARQYNFQAYQDTGEANYYRAEARYSALVDICDIALNVSEIRDKGIKINAELSILATKAAKMRHDGCYREPEEVKNFLYLVTQTAERFGWSNPYS